MPHVTGDRVKDTTSSTGTGNITVSGSAPTGFRTLSAVATADGDTCFIAIVGGSEWEVCLATRVSANVYSRATPLASSNSGSAVNFAAGTKDVFITAAARELGRNYPPGIYGPRRESWFAAFTESMNLGNTQYWGAARWFTSATASGSRVNAGGGRPACRWTPSGTQLFQATTPVGSVADADGPLSYRNMVRVSLRANGSAAPDATDDYIFVSGINDTWSATGHTTGLDYAVFAYYQSAGVALFEARTRRAAGTAEVTSLTLPSADTFYTLEVVVTSADVKFYVDGVLVATHTAVPDGVVGDGFRLARVAGSNARSMDVLFMATEIEWASNA